MIGNSKYMKVTDTKKLGKKKIELQRITKGDLEFDSVEDAHLFREFLQARDYLKFGDGRIELPEATPKNKVLKV